MRKYCPDFVWNYSEKRRVEFNPQAELFIIEPETMEVVKIKEPNTVSSLLHPTLFYYVAS